jgi:Acetyltransferase (GNAT) domain
MPHYSTSDGSTQDQGRFEIIRDYPPPALEHRWRDCLRNADFVTHYTTPEYFREPFFGDKKPFAVLSLIDEDVVAACTGIHDGPSVKCGLSVRPQVIVSRSADTEVAAAGLVAGLRAEGRSYELIDVFTWSRLPSMTRHGFRERQEEGSVVLDLSLGPDALFRKFSRTRRQDIRTSIRAGVTVEVSTSTNDMIEYYENHRAWAERKGLPVQPWEQVENAVSLVSNRRLFLARHEGKVIASLTVRFAPSGVAEAAGSSSLAASLDLHPNDLLHWRAIEWACAQGLRHYSLGASHLFLRKFGGPVVPSYRYRLDNTLLRTHTVRDLVSEFTKTCTSYAPPQLITMARRLRDNMKKS